MRFDMRRVSAAHRTLPFGTVVQVRHRGRTVAVQITDRGPFVEGRCLDLSRRAFATIARLGRGVIDVRYRVVKEAER